MNALGVQPGMTCVRLLRSPILLHKVMQMGLFGRILHAIIHIEQYSGHGVIVAFSRAMTDI